MFRFVHQQFLQVYLSCRLKYELEMPAAATQINIRLLGVGYFEKRNKQTIFNKYFFLQRNVNIFYFVSCRNAEVLLIKQETPNMATPELFILLCLSRPSDIENNSQLYS